jgi:hypothetical protein
MAKPKIDWGNLTDEETLAITREALEHLSSDEVASLIKETFSPDDLAEIAAQIT